MYTAEIYRYDSYQFEDVSHGGFLLLLLPQLSQLPQVPQLPQLFVPKNGTRLAPRAI